MRRQLKGLFLSAITNCTLLTLPSTSLAENLQVSVSVYGDARLPGNTLARAEQRAADVFSRAGLEITWIDSVNPRTACHSMVGPASLILRITTRVARSTSDTAFGLAYLGSDGSGRCADVFWQRVLDLKANSNIEVGLILGSVMAHEMGHLLLGSNAHAVSGIMQARWQSWELQRINMGDLVFLSSQGRRMRMRITQQMATSNLLKNSVRAAEMQALLLDPE